MLVLLNLHTFEVTKQGSSYVMYYNQQQIEEKRVTDTSHYTAFFQISKYFCFHQDFQYEGWENINCPNILGRWKISLKKRVNLHLYCDVRAMA
jgi:hypothetical protein